MPKQRTKQYLLFLTPEEHEGIKSEAAKLGISMADFIRLLYKQWIDGLVFTKEKVNGSGGDNSEKTVS
jgi:hypothetical protein